MNINKEIIIKYTLKVYAYHNCYLYVSQEAQGAKDEW